ncbi:hypothetical protein SK224_05490 [Microbacterium sp. BG28]|uniref:hypothetical protein n=1 Tax=Microbacterium sp. BG28 TaxID=3097356 RepID=UPI002A5993D2|nr:hypothetical protein [Microbacterium sp. BG28]MDY0828577.1 hypothetical protein [Microbacterium sp. BG28]
MAARQPAAGVNPHRLGERGLALYDAVAQARKLTPTELVTLVEACRLADRLERFDELINGERDEWLRLDVNDDGSEITVVLTDVVRQARMHAATLKALLAGFESSAAAASEDAQPSGEVPGNVADIKSKLPPTLGGPAARQKRSAK